MMTIEEIEMTLPNGFHDACIEKITIDYDTQEAKLEMLIDISNPESVPPMPANRKGILILSGLLFFMIDPPSYQYFSQEQKIKGLWVTSSGSSATSKEIKLPPKIATILPKNSFSHYFFINNWNAFIVVAAADAQFAFE